jgi:hypothetical protein
MLVIGGTPDTNNTVCDARESGGQHGLLLGQESVEVGTMWHDLKSDVSSYRVPDNIVAVIGGG